MVPVITVKVDDENSSKNQSLYVINTKKMDKILVKPKKKVVYRLIIMFNSSCSRMYITDLYPFLCMYIC